MARIISPLHYATSFIRRQLKARHTEKFMARREGQRVEEHEMMQRFGRERIETLMQEDPVFDAKVEKIQENLRWRRKSLLDVPSCGPRLFVMM